MMVDNRVGIDTDGVLGIGMGMEIDRSRAVDMVGTALDVDSGTAVDMEPDVNMLEA